MSSSIYHIYSGKDDLSSLTGRLLDKIEFKKLLTPEGYVPIKVQIDLTDRPSLTEIIREVMHKSVEAYAVPYVTETISTLMVYKENVSMFEWMELATKKGIRSSFELPLLPLDGACGTDGLFIPVVGKEIAATFVSNALLWSANLVVLSSVTCDPLTGMEGSLKSLGFGCVTVQGKRKLHDVLKPAVVAKRCTKCGRCDICNWDAIQWSFGYPSIVGELCKGCMLCYLECPDDAISIPTLQRKRYNIRLVDTCLGVRKAFSGNICYINLIEKVTPRCGPKYPNKPIIPDLGLLVSTDPVAIDKASLDLINNALGIPHTAAETCDVLKPGKNKVEAITGFDPNYTFKLAEDIGLGSTTYELIEI